MAPTGVEVRRDGFLTTLVVKRNHPAEIKGQPWPAAKCCRMRPPFTVQHSSVTRQLGRCDSKNRPSCRLAVLTPPEIPYFLIFLAGIFRFILNIYT
jgi:hypothetical protein